MKIFLSFAQDGEDIVLFHLLQNVKDPIFWVDVGANDPVKLSVTKFFSNRGDRGINIDPLKQCINALKEDRPDDINIEAGVSDEEGSLTLYGEGTWATFDPKFSVAGDATFTVPVHTLSKICEENISNKQDIHFLKVDVEGWEEKVLKGMDFQRFRPWIICMESVEPGTENPSWESWEDILINASYQFLGMSGVNRYYMAEERASTVENYKNYEDLKREYIIIKYDDVDASITYFKHETASLALKRSIKLSTTMRPFVKAYKKIRTTHRASRQ